MINYKERIAVQDTVEVNREMQWHLARLGEFEEPKITSRSKVLVADRHACDQCVLLPNDYHGVRTLQLAYLWMVLNDVDYMTVADLDYFKYGRDVDYDYYRLSFKGNVLVSKEWLIYAATRHVGDSCRDDHMASSHKGKVALLTQVQTGELLP